MYEYQSKIIKGNELYDVCRKATYYFLGSFMLEIIMRRKEWENPETKTSFIQSLHDEYFAWDEKCSIERTRNRVNCAIRIIESKKVEETLNYVINANDKKINIIEAKENAIYLLEQIRSEKIKY